MKTTIEINGTSMAIAIEGRLDTLTAPDLQAELEKYNLAELTEIVLDLEKTEYISSAGLRVLLLAYRGLKQGGTLRVVKANDITRKVFEVTGFQDLFEIE